MCHWKTETQKISLWKYLSITETSVNELIWAEPGYYEDGSFGIRLENVLIVKEAITGYNFDGKGYLAFEHITWVHIVLIAFAFGVCVHVSDSNIELQNLHPS
jgi:hypothetical protein